jgi:hypothetical protein
MIQNRTGLGLSTIVSAIALCITTAQAADSTSDCAPKADADKNVVQTLNQLYEAMRADDLAGFHSVVTPDYYLFDGANGSPQTP